MFSSDYLGVKTLTSPQYHCLSVTEFSETIVRRLMLLPSSWFVLCALEEILHVNYTEGGFVALGRRSLWNTPGFENSEIAKIRSIYETIKLSRTK